MKKIMGRIILTLSLIVGIYLTCYAGNSTTYIQCVVDAIEYEQLIADREENISLLEGIKFNGENLFYDKSSRTFFYSLVEGDSQAYNPSVKIISEYEDVQIAFMDSGLTEEMVENNLTVSILAYTQDSYCCSNLVCTTLPLMNISCAEDIDEEYIPMEVTVFDNSRGAANRMVTYAGSIRIRGGGSRAYPKKGYRIKLTKESMGGNDRANNVSLLGMRQDNDWILYAGYNDQEKVRNVFSSNLWKYSCASDNENHIDMGVEYKYLELFINGEYWGLYALGYPIDKKQLGFSEDVLKDSLYKITWWLDERYLNFAEDGSVSEYELSDVSEETEEGWKLLTEYYNNLYSNRTESEELYKWIDIDNIIDTYLFIDLIQGVDHAGRYQENEIFNLYLAITTSCFGEKKGLYIPWDMDRTWGNGFDELQYSVRPDYQVGLKYHVHMGVEYLNQIISNRDTDIWEKIFDKYWALRNGAWSNEAIYDMIDEYESDIFDSGAYLRDMARWPNGVYADPEDKLNTFRQYVTERLKEEDLYYERLANVCQGSFLVRKSAEYEEFERCRFFIVVNDKGVLQDSDYVDLLEYLKIDVGKITDDIRYIVAVPSINSAEYFKTLGVGGDTISTRAGEITLDGDSTSYLVKLDGIVCYHVMQWADDDLVIMFVHDSGIVERMNLRKP